jgi:hypothetical protein
VTTADPLVVVLDYCRRQWSPIPVPYCEKAPTIEGWPSLRIGALEAPRYFDGQRQNIGILVGVPSNHLVDVDLDCSEALELADRYLPATQSLFGRASKRGAHRIYQAPGTKTAKFVDPTRPASQGMLLEARSTGSQTIFPGSTHPSGEPIEWDNDGEPASVAAEQLVRACGRLGAACLLLRHLGAEVLEQPVEEWIRKLEAADARLGRVARAWLGQEAAPSPRTGRAWSGDGEGRRYALAALAREVEEVAETGPGNQSDRLNQSARKLAEFAELTDDEITEALSGAAARWRNDPEREPWTETEIRRTIESGIEAGRGHPARRTEILRNSYSDRGLAPSEAPWPAALAVTAYHGLAGEFVHAIEPHTEADPVALLVQFLCMIGNCVGRESYYPVGSARHCGNLDILLVGETSRARKGTGLAEVRGHLPAESDKWAKTCISSGLSSGEGLIERVRDRQTKMETNKKTGHQIEVEIDPGVSDKRLLVIEEEFARPLRVMARAENTLSAILRLAWDGGDLANLTRNSPLYATAPHISIIGHCTRYELKRELDDVSMANGFGNRVLFYCVKRSKCLPFGGNVDQEVARQLGQRIAAVIEQAKPGPIEMDDAAKASWQAKYTELTADRPGMLGALTARSEAQAVRVALIYALLDRSDKIGNVHLDAALELLRYEIESVRYIFGDALGDPVADRILAEMRQVAPAGISRLDISNLFGRNQSSGRITLALSLLSRFGLARFERQAGSTRSIEMWFAC